MSHKIENKIRMGLIIWNGPLKGNENGVPKNSGAGLCSSGLWLLFRACHCQFSYSTLTKTK